MHQDPRVMKTLGGVRSDLETQRFLETNLEHWHRNGYGLWIFRADTLFVGRAGLRQVEVGGSLEVELAYALMSEHWGKGLATEVCAIDRHPGIRRPRSPEHRRLHADDQPGVTARHGKDGLYV